MLEGVLRRPLAFKLMNLMEFKAFGSRKGGPIHAAGSD
jgi:hypothetical protein